MNGAVVLAGLLLTQGASWTLPRGCTGAAHPGGNDYTIVCGKTAHAEFSFAQGGTGEPALQQLVNAMLAHWTGLNLISNDKHATFKGLPARSIFAVGTSPDGTISNVQIIAVPKDGGWYAIGMWSGLWPEDKTYFIPLRDGFRFK
jgi:hypothetical protein